MSARVLATLWDGARVTVRVELKPADAWVGAFWRREWLPPFAGRTVLDVWVCVVPCLPIHVSVRDPEPATDRG